MDGVQYTTISALPSAEATVLGQLSRLALELAKLERLKCHHRERQESIERTLSAMEMTAQLMDLACHHLDTDVLTHLREATALERRATRSACDAVRLAVTDETTLDSGRSEEGQA